MSPKKSVLAFLCLLLILSSALFGQVTSASLSGTITDSSGAAVPEAALTIKNTGTGVVRSVSSDSQGRYTVADLPIGQYDIQASKTGFQSSIRSNVTFTVGSSPVIDFQLNVGQVDETVNVSGSVSQVETTTASVSSLVDQQQMRELPLNGRNFEQLILLAPGAATYPAAGASSLVGRSATYSISGGRPEGYAILLDGEDQQNWWQRGSGAQVTGTSLGIEAIAEFQTLTNTYSAEFGGNGGVINAATKSGTNEVHGSAYDFLRNSALDARSFFDGASPPPFRKNQFGGSVGGPIKKNKIFYFGNYEGIRQLLGGSTPVFTPTAAIRATAVPSVQPILALYPLPTTDLGNGTGTLTEVANQIAQEDYFLGRIDYTISDKDAIFGRYLSDVGTLVNPSAIPLWPVTDTTHNQFATLNERHIFSPTLLNQFNLSYSRPVSREVQPDTHPALQLFPGRYDTAISVPGLTGLGAGIVTPFGFYQNKFTVTDGILWTKGNHNIKFGLTFRRQQINGFVQTYWNGQYTFTSLQNFLAGIPLQFTGAPEGNTYTNRDFRDISLNPYIQDDWKVSSKLTLNIGLRYEWQSNPVEIRNNLHNIVNPLTDTGYTNVPHAWAHNPSTLNFDPRFGFAYDVFGDHKTSLRGGFAIMHDPLQTYTFFAGYDGTPPFLTVNQSICPPTAAGCTYPEFPTPFATSSAPAKPSLTNGTNYNIDNTPYMMQWNLNVEREFGGTVLTAGYVGTRGIHLLSFRDFNPPVATIDANGVMHFGSTRLNQNFGSLDLYDTSTTSSYNALQVALKRNLTSGLLGQLSYTYSHCIDDGPPGNGLGGNNGSNAVSNPYDQAADKGNCGFDIRHNLTINAVYMLPFHRNRLVSGWQVTGIESYRTGVPFTILTGFDQAGLLNNFDQIRPNYIAGCNVSAGQNVNLWFNPACFSLQPAGTIGNLGRNTGLSPGYVSTDFAVLKETVLRERLRIQFRAELFNIFNHTNLGVPSLSVFSSNGTVLANAGRITSIVGTARQIQFGLKVLF